MADAARIKEDASPMHAPDFTNLQFMRISQFFLYYLDFSLPYRFKRLEDR